MLSRIQAVYRYIKAEKARSDALVEEGRRVLGWRSRGAAAERTYSPTASPICTCHKLA
jgi:hypothetical protein